MEGASISLSEDESQVRQFLAASYPVEFGEPLVAASEKMASIGLIKSDLEGKADWDSAELMGGPE